MEISEFEEVLRKRWIGKERRSERELVLDCLLQLDSESFRLPDLLKRRGLIVRMEKSASERMARFERRNGEWQHVRESVRTSFVTLTRRLWPDTAKGKGETWRKALEADSDRAAEAIIIQDLKAKILDAAKQPDADFLIKLGDALKALRRSRREQKIAPLPTKFEASAVRFSHADKLHLFLLRNWEEGYSADAGAGHTNEIPPLSMFADRALKNLVAALKLPAFNNKAVTRALSLKRLHAPLVRTVLVTGKILRLS